MSYNNYNRGYAEPTMTSADYMTRTYRWMALGLLITFAAAFVTATTPLFYVVNSLYLLFTIAALALVVAVQLYLPGQCGARPHDAHIALQHVCLLYTSRCV